ncbi:MAG TPA: hypothetical protein VK021_02120 [Flavobacteriaceae bacterium]|nr:hypothetical protein [Flavobacteriaceae bacterium]
MSNLVDKLNSVEEKIFRLLDLRNQLQEENSELKSRIEQQSEQILTLQSQIEKAQNENHSLKTANALLGSKEFKRETKFKINNLVREIDHCISQLSE